MNLRRLGIAVLIGLVGLIVLAGLAGVAFIIHLFLSYSSQAVYVVGGSSGKPVCETRHAWYITSAVFSPDGRLLASADTSGRIVLSSVPDGNVMHEIASRRGASYMQFSPDGRLLVVASGLESEGTTTYDHLGVWRVRDGREVSLFRDALSPAGSGADRPFLFSPDGKLLVAETSGGCARVFLVNDGSLIGSLRDSDYGVQRVAISPDSKLIATVDSSAVVIWRELNGKFVTLASFQAAPVLRIAFSPDGRMLAAVGSHGTYLYRVNDGRLLHRDEAEAFVAFSRDGEMVATDSGRATMASVRRVADGTLVCKVPATISPEGGVTDIAFLSRDRLAVEVVDSVASHPSPDYAVRVFSLKKSRAVLVYSLDHRVLEDVSPDGSLLAISGPPPRH